MRTICKPPFGPLAIHLLDSISVNNPAYRELIYQTIDESTAGRMSICHEMSRKHNLTIHMFIGVVGENWNDPEIQEAELNEEDILYYEMQIHFKEEGIMLIERADYVERKFHYRIHGVTLPASQIELMAGKELHDIVDHPLVRLASKTGAVVAGADEVKGPGSNPLRPTFYSTKLDVPEDTITETVEE